jgi:hypothetical protein
MRFENKTIKKPFANSSGCSCSIIVFFHRNINMQQVLFGQNVCMNEPLRQPALSAARQAGLGFAVAGRTSERSLVVLFERWPNEQTLATERHCNYL